MKHPFTVLTLGAVLQLAPPAYAAGTAPEDKTIVFVCVHGSVKSQIAAAYFNRLARERGLYIFKNLKDVPGCGSGDT